MLINRVLSTDTYKEAFHLFMLGQEQYDQNNYKEAGMLLKKAADEFGKEFVPLESYSGGLRDEQSNSELNRFHREILNDDIEAIRKNRIYCYEWAKHCYQCIGDRKAIAEIDVILASMKPVEFAVSGK